MFTCNICNKSFKTNPKLLRHQANIHDINVVWHTCGIDGCNVKCKDPHNLNIHKAHVHNIVKKWYECNVGDCKLKFKTTSDFKRHQSHIHNIGIKWYECTIDPQKCKEKFKIKPNLDRHIQRVHNIGTVWYPCSVCEYKSKAKADLQKHLSNIHDIGDKQCEFCLGNRYLLTPYQSNDTISKICRACYNKATGKNSRIETEMSNYLDEHFGKDFLIGSDKRINGEACTRYRPDKLYASPDTVLHIECDENQHQYNPGDYSCDERRISEIYDEFPGKKYIVVRWNPDAYTPPENVTKISKKKDRLRILLDKMTELMKSPPEDQIHIYYLFYDADNPLISQNIPHTLVYN